VFGSAESEGLFLKSARNWFCRFSLLDLRTPGELGPLVFNH
jgi:hypothetical protein